MKKTIATLLAIGAAGLAVWAAYLMISAPAEPPAGWRMNMSEEQHALLIGPINHAYRVAAYAVTWAIQVGYVAWMAMRWQNQDQPRPAAE